MAAQPSNDEVLSPSEAARRLRRRERDAMAWLRAHGLIREVPGLGSLVLWSDVAAKIRELTDSPAPTSPPAKGRRPRIRL